MSVREESVRARVLCIVEHAVFAFVGWSYENRDPRGGLTYALRTRKSGIITLDVTSRHLTVDVLSARQARDIPRILPGFVARYIPRCRRDVIAQLDRNEIRKGLSRRGEERR